MKEIFYNFFGHNKALFYFLNHATNYGILPFLLKHISSIFNIENFAIAYFVLCLYQYIKLKRLDNNLFEDQFNKIYERFVYVGISYAIFGLTYAYLKFTINLPRPFCSLPDESFFTIIDVTQERCLSSFPSAHTGLAILVTYLLWRYLNIWLKALFSGIIFLTALSRITLAMHYPSDILYSALIVLLVILVTKIMFSLLKNNVIKYCKIIIIKILFYDKKL